MATLVRRNSKAYFLETLTLQKFLEWKNSGEHGVKPLVFVKKSATVREAFRLMTSNHILSLPVWDDAEGEFTCFLSVVDVLRFCMTDADRQVTKGRSSPRPMDAPLDDIVADLVNADDEGAHIEVFEPTALVTKVLEWFTMGLHRVLVADPSMPGQPAGSVISQSDVLLYLHEHGDGIRETTYKTIDEHGFLGDDTPSIGPRTLISIGANKTALEGFERLFKDRTNAAAVVDEDGKLLDNLSVSDLRTIDEAQVEQQMMLPVLDYLAVTAGHRQPITCTRQSTLEEVINTLAQHRVHRVWVTSETGTVEGVLTLTDIICKFAPFDYKLLHSKKV